MNIKKNFFYFYKRFRFKSVFFKNLVFYIVIVMIPVLIFASFYYIDTMRNSYNELKNSNMLSLRTVHDTTDSIVSELMQFAYKTGENRDVTIFMASENPDFNNIKLWDKIKENNIGFSNIYNYIDSVYVFSEAKQGIIHNNEYFDIDKFSDNSWYNIYKKSEDDKIQVFLRYKNESYPSFITILKPKIFFNKKVGAVVINVDISKLISLNAFGEGLKEANGIITDESGEIYYSENKLFVNNNFIALAGEKNWSEIKNNNTESVELNGEKYFISLLKSEMGNINYTVLYPVSAYNLHNTSVVYITLFFIVLFLLFGIFLAVCMTYFSIRPINNIVEFIDNNDFDEDLMGPASTNELNYIIEYTKELLRAKTDAKKNIINLKKAYNLALQSQINPHFLCNTLEVINWKSIELNGGDNIVSEMITDLGDIYEFLLRVNDYMVTLKEEITYVELYSKILKYRYKNKFEVVWNINEEILSYKIIKLSLQPIFENAVYHGIKPLGKKGIIEINGDFCEEGIFIEIKDNGVGMSGEKLAELNEEINKDFNIFDEHIGVANVNQRLKMIYKDNCGVEIKSSEGEGTSVKLVFMKEI